MSVLSAFLEPEYTVETVDVIVSDRFKDKETGQPVPFKIRTLTQAEMSTIRKRSLVTKSVDGRKYQEVDNDLFLCNCLVEGVVSPDMKNAQLCEKYGTVNPADVPRNMLLGKEFERLGRAFMELNGIGEDSPELGEISKN